MFVIVRVVRDFVKIWISLYLHSCPSIKDMWLDTVHIKELVHFYLCRVYLSSQEIHKFFLYSDKNEYGTDVKNQSTLETRERKIEVWEDLKVNSSRLVI